MKKTFWLFLTTTAAIFVTVIWMIEAPGSCYAKGFFVGRSVCHQIPSHSFIREDIQFPLCARCTGLYMGSAFGLVYFFLQKKRKALPGKEYLILLLFFFLAWAGDGINSFISDFINAPFLYQTTNLTRLITGLGMGLVMSVALTTLFNLTVWKSGMDEPALRSFWQVLLYFGASAILSFLLLATGTLAFQALAVVAIITVLAIITMLYTVFWVILTRHENQATDIPGLLPYLMAGFTTAIAQVILLNALRDIILG